MSGEDRTTFDAPEDRDNQEQAPGFRFEPCDRLRIVGLPVAAPARLNLYVPHPESRLCTELAHGSAIVGLPLASGEIRIYYEGNVIGAVNLDRYRQRAAQAP